MENSQGALRSDSPRSRGLLPAPVPQCPSAAEMSLALDSPDRVRLPFNLTSSGIGDTGASS